MRKVDDGNVMFDEVKCGFGLVNICVFVYILDLIGLFVDFVLGEGGVVMDEVVLNFVSDV